MLLHLWEELETLTILIVPGRDLERAVQLLAKEVIVYSRTENWIVVHDNQASELLRKLAENGIIGRIEVREYARRHGASNRRLT